jgi:hypothetical protein
MNKRIHSTAVAGTAMAFDGDFEAQGFLHQGVGEQSVA